MTDFKDMTDVTKILLLSRIARTVFHYKAYVLGVPRFDITPKMQGLSLTDYLEEQRKFINEYIREYY